MFACVVSVSIGDRHQIFDEHGKVVFSEDYRPIRIGRPEEVTKFYHATAGD